MPDKKKYFVTSITLCAIAAAAALAIGGVNLLTKDTIARNEALAQENAMKEVFADAKSFSDQQDEFEIDAKYLVYYCIAYSSENQTGELGYIYYTDGRNAYGEVSMMVGITDAGIGEISVVTDTQTFATTLEDNYITPYAEGEISLDDTSCGATYGATLIRNMAYEALEDYQARKGA